jgi:lambda repressor-like predicted transcriptional regulator
MNELTRRLRDLDAMELEGHFARIAGNGRPYDRQLKTLSLSGRKGWSHKALQAKFRKYLAAGKVVRAYYGSEAEQNNPPLDWRGWKPAELVAVLRMAGLTQEEWARKHGENGAAVSYALNGKKNSRGSQKAVDKLAAWAKSFLKRRVKKLTKPARR